jgi:DNA invertase Pin-like site-specific DNA recombinase
LGFFRKILIENEVAERIEDGLAVVPLDALRDVGVVGEMEKVQIKERQIEGIRVAKMKGIYLGRKTGSKETTLSFLSKEKNKKALDYLKKGYKVVEVAKLTDLHLNTITKIKKLGIK